VWISFILRYSQSLNLKSVLLDKFEDCVDLWEVMEMTNRFNWVEIRVRDLQRAKDFYGKLFDWKITGDENKDWAYWLIDTGEKPSGGLWRFPKEKPLGVLVYVAVDDIDKTLEEVTRLGGKVVAPKSRENGNAMATIADPDGNVLGLHQSAKK
jgi:predicted enzyme related to lactoylglutathione lyase